MTRRIKTILKALIPALRHRPTVLRLHRLADALRGIPARTRLALSRRSEIAAANVAKREKRIVFVADNPLRRETKFAYALKRAGWDVVLITAGQPRFDTSDFAEVQTYRSSWEALELARKTHNPLFHNFTSSYDEASIRLVDDKPGRVIFDFYDYFFALSDGLPVRDHHIVEIETQAHCIARADAVCVPDIQLQYRRHETKVARGKPVLCFPNYCWDREPLAAPRADASVRIVQIGWLEFGEDVGSLRVTREFLAAGCEFHIFLHPSMPPLNSSEFRSRFAPYLLLQEEFAKLQFRASVLSHMLPAELMKYDYGFNMIDGSTYGAKWEGHNPAWLPLLASGRLYDYLDAGLPSICDGNLAFNRHLFGPRVFVDGTALVHQGRIFETLRARKLNREEILCEKSRLSVERHIGRLIRFYESLG